MFVLFGHMVYSIMNMFWSHNLNHEIIGYKVAMLVNFLLSFELKLLIAFLQKDCFEVYALVPGLLREEVRKLCCLVFKKKEVVLPFILLE